MMNRRQYGRLAVLLAALLMILPCLAAQADGIDYQTVRSYESDTLRYTVESFEQYGVTCYISRIWMQDPGRQITKATAVWEESMALPSEMAEKLDCNPALVVNGSGYVSPVFPEIPDNYPGGSSDYYFTPLGSLTITNGTVFRDLKVPFYGLTLQADGLHMHVGDDTAEVLAQDPTETWSFYVECPFIRDGVSILDPDWKFTNTKHIRTIIAKVDAQDYVLLTVTNKGKASGWTMAEATEYLLNEIHPEWAYDLDGGPSSALLARDRDSDTLDVLWGNKSKDADIMAFCELAE